MIPKLTGVRNTTRREAAKSLTNTELGHENDQNSVNLVDQMPNTVFPSLSPEQLPANLRTLRQRAIETRGEARFVEAAALAPEVLDWYLNSFYQQLFGSDRVEQRFKELGRLRLSLTHGCRSCNQGNRRDALSAGINQQQIDDLQANRLDNFTQREQAVISLADELALTSPDGRLGPSLYQRLKAGFSDAQIFELGMVFGLLAGMAKFMFVFDLVEREESCPFPFSSQR